MVQLDKVTAVIGAQYGSEGKGVVVHKIATEQHFSCHVRTGGPNAGHSFVHKGKPFVVQSVPVGFVDPNSTLILGAGAVINFRILDEEVKFLDNMGFGVKERLYIDRNATVLDSRDEEEEGHTRGELHHRIGSTGEGVGSARRKRMRRVSEERSIVRFNPTARERGYMVTDTVRILDGSNSILLEGTQGSGLSIVHGPWPYVTTADTNSAQLCADAGIPATRLGDVIIVARTFPIRVWGPSGPLNDELDWETMSKMLGKTVEEKTTVTKKKRRIGKWDPALIQKAIMLNGYDSKIALTFLDYLNPEDEYVTDYENLSDISKEFVQKVDREHGEVIMAGTGVSDKDGWTCCEL